MPNYLTTPIPHSEAAQLIADKPALVREEFDQLLPELKSLAFTVSGVQDYDVLQSIQTKIATLPEGGDWDTLKADIAAELDTILSPQAAQRRAELLLRTHGFQAYARTQHAIQERQTDAFPYKMYLATGDERTRSSHQALDQRVLPADSPFWNNHTPPWEWGCRCDVVMIDAEEAREMLTEDANARPEQRRVLTGEQLRKLEEEQTLLDKGGLPIQAKTQVEREGEGYEFRPNDLRLPLEEIEARYDGETLSAWRDWSETTEIPGRQDSLTVRQWMAGETIKESPRRVPRASRTSPNQINQYLKNLRQPQPAKASIRISQISREDNPALTPEILETLDEIAAIIPAEKVKKLPKIRLEINSDLKSADGKRIIAGAFNTLTNELKINAQQTRQELRRTIYHEFGHWLWQGMASSKKTLIEEHFQLRTKGDPVVMINGKPHKRDNWIHELAGLIDATEIIPYYLETLALNEIDLARHLQIQNNRDSLGVVLEAIQATQ